MLIKRELGDQIIGHASYDATAIEAREKTAKKPLAEKKPKAKAGRPRKEEERPPKEKTVLEWQQEQHVKQMLEEMPKSCDIGTKKNSKGFKVGWKGYKLHITTADGDIPIAAVLSSASMHDSGAMLPLMRLCQDRGFMTWLTALIAARLSVVSHEKPGMFR